MLRDYKDTTSDKVTMFTGVEIEHTVALGQKTLFVVGYEYDPTYVVKVAKENECGHVYIGANASFDSTADPEIMDLWIDLFNELKSNNLWITLDFKSQHVEWVTSSNFNEYDKFIPMISVDIPYINILNSNACMKIDDKDFKYSNDGVWVHQLQTLQNSRNMTTWDQYTSDIPLDTK